MQEAQQALSSVFDAITLEEMAVRAGQKSLHKNIRKESKKV
jgi:DNA-binding IscR family transcriptional regulator